LIEKNQNHATKEITVVTRIVEQLLAAGTTWVDKDGQQGLISFEDILIVAPYNDFYQPSDVPPSSQPASARRLR
jgi:hypothetical protein